MKHEELTEKLKEIQSTLGKEDKENAQQEADRIAKDFLRNNGFKMEGE